MGYPKYNSTSPILWLVNSLNIATAIHYLRLRVMCHSQTREVTSKKSKANVTFSSVAKMENTRLLVGDAIAVERILNLSLSSFESLYLGEHFFISQLTLMLTWGLHIECNTVEVTSSILVTTL